MSDYLKEVKNEDEFRGDRKNWIKEMLVDDNLQKNVIETLVGLEQHRYTYQWDWLGVPIIKMPEEIMIIQEVMYQIRPTAVIEVGVARGGGVSLYHSLQTLLGITPNILGIDIKFFPHTLSALSKLQNQGVRLVEGRSLDSSTKEILVEFLKGHQKVFVILDGDHSHENVLKELRMFHELLPQDSVVLCADTLVSKIRQTGLKRNWDESSNPATALSQFLSENRMWQPIKKVNEKVILSESPNGWIQKIGEETSKGHSANIELA